MVRTGSNRLQGSVEVNETYVGGAKSEGKKGEGSEIKAIVIILKIFQDNLNKKKRHLTIMYRYYTLFI
jgi:hypothetical protein